MRNGIRYYKRQILPLLDQPSLAHGLLYELCDSQVSIKASMSFLTQTTTFEAWLGQNLVEISPKVHVADLRAKGQGRAVVALQDIEEDEVVFKIPRSVLLNAENCSLVKDYPEIEAGLLKLGQWEALILVVMYEWKVKKTSSRWAPYFDVLPLNDTENYKFNQLIFWTDAELGKLAPSLIVDRIGRESAKNMYNNLFPKIAVYSLGIVELKDVSLQEFNFVATVIMSYSFDVENAKENDEDEDSGEEDDLNNDNDDSVKDSGYFKSMVPLADTLNADTHKHNASLMYTPSNLVMRAIKPIAKGEQVYNTYSDHPNAEILRRYGYVEQQGSAHDFAEVPLNTIKKFFAESTSLSSETVEDVLSVLKEIEREEEESFILDAFDIYASGEITFEFTFLVQFFTVVACINDQRSFNATSLDVKNRGLRRVFKKCYQFLESGKLTKSYVDIYKKILMLRMSEYPKIATTDFKPFNSELSRADMSAIVLKSEHKSLKNCLDFDKVYKSGETVYGTIDDDKLLRNIMKKDIFEGSDEKSYKKRKHN